MLHIQPDLYIQLSHLRPTGLPSLHLVLSFTFSAVLPKAESEATVGVWTNMGSLCQVLIEGSEEIPSTTTLTANRSRAGWEGGRLGLNGKNCKQMEKPRILEERSRDGSADIWMFAISNCCLWDLFLRHSAERSRRVPDRKSL